MAEKKPASKKHAKAKPLRQSQLSGRPKPCALCAGKTGDGDFCFGCNQWVCSDCCTNLECGGFGHDVSEHAEAPIGA